METVTKHTCGGPVFGRKTPGCPCCDQLLAGAPPVEWAGMRSKKDRERDEQQDRLARPLRTWRTPRYRQMWACLHLRRLVTSRTGPAATTCQPTIRTFT
jgi:hypothetical protein